MLGASAPGQGTSAGLLLRVISSRWRGVLALSAGETVAWGILYYGFGVLLAARRDVASGLSIALLASAAAAPLIGRWIARAGARRVMTAGAVTAVPALVLLAVVDEPYVLVGLWIIVGVVQAATLYEPAFAAVSEWFVGPSDRRRAFVVLTSIGGLASTIFVPLTAWLFERVGWRGALLALAAVIAAVLVPLNATLPCTKPSGGEAPRARISTARIAPLAATFALHAFATTGATVHLAVYLVGRGHELAGAARVLAIAGAAQVFGRIVVGRFARAGSARSRLGLAFGAQAVALIAFGLPDPTVVCGAAVVFGAASGLSTLERATLALDEYGPRHYPFVNGRIASVALAARAGAPLGVAIVAARASYAVAYVGLAVVFAVAAALVTFSASIRHPSRL